MAHDASGVSGPHVAQLPLRFPPAPAARFGTFVSGSNRAAAEHAAAVAAGGGAALWIYGAAGTGKSHLLQAACAAAAERGRRAMYVPLGALDGASAAARDDAGPAARDAVGPAALDDAGPAALDDAGPAALDDLEALDLLALDGLERAAGDASWERRLFQLFNDQAARGSGLLLAARVAPRALGFALPDLASRAAGAVVYRLQPLDDAERAAALILHARGRGLELEPAAAEFLLNRVARDMNVLTSWLERLDRESLASGKRLTIPFIRALLEERG